MEGIYEHFFFLKYYGGWSFTEAYNLPIGLREWFVDKLNRQLEIEMGAQSENSSGNTKTLSVNNQPPPPPGAPIK